MGLKFLKMPYYQVNGSIVRLIYLTGANSIFINGRIEMGVF